MTRIEKIEFKDLPNTETPITATNLNQLQDNILNVLNNLTGAYIYNVDLNDMKTTGLFHLGDGLLNSPNNTNFIVLMVIDTGYNDGVQMAITIASPSMYIRSRNNNVWSNWVEMKKEV